MTELALQKQVAQYLDMIGYLWAHPVNEGKRSAKYGAHLKKQGLKPGLPDVLIFEDWQQSAPVNVSGDNPFRGHGIAIELKHGSNRLTESQQGWLNALESKGWLCFVCYSLDEVMRACEHIR